MKEKALRLKFDVRSALAREPSLALFNQFNIWWAQYKARGHIDGRECRVGADTSFVIDGCQGSGNSFATVAFKQSQEQPVRIAHHLHSPAQILKAVAKGIPTLVTIREPVATVVSMMSRWPYIYPDQALKYYAEFHRAISPARDGFVLSAFERTIHHLDDVIADVNAQFGTDFSKFNYSDESVERVRSKTQLASPYERAREDVKRAMTAQVTDPAHARLIGEAERVYEMMLASE